MKCINGYLTIYVSANQVIPKVTLIVIVVIILNISMETLNFINPTVKVKKIISSIIIYKNFKTI